MNIDLTLQIMEFERQAFESRLRHEAAEERYRLVQDTLNAAMRIYVAQITTPLEAMVWAMRAGFPTSEQR